MAHWCPMTHRNRGILLCIGETVYCTQKQHGSLVSHDSQAQGHNAEFWRDRLLHTETAWFIGVP